MSWTKRQIVEQAFEEIGISTYVFDLQPGQLQSAMYKLDAMMAEWDAKGIRLGYPISSSQNNADLDDDSGLPDWCVGPVYTNLGMRLAPSFGKQIHPATRADAKMGYNVILQRAARPPEMQFPHELPLGAGNKPWRDYDDEFVRGPLDPLLAGSDGELEFD